jgi:hypothetical protein
MNDHGLGESLAGVATAVSAILAARSLPRCRFADDLWRFPRNLSATETRSANNSRQSMLSTVSRISSSGGEIDRLFFKYATFGPMNRNFHFAFRL